MATEIKYFAHIKAKGICPNCGNSIFLNGVSKHMFCYSCLKNFKLNKEIPVEFVQTCYDELKESPMQETGYSYPGTYDYRFGNNPPACPECGEIIPKKKLVDKEGEENWEIVCEKCEKSIPVAKIPAWIKKKIKAAVIVINAETVTEQTNHELEPTKLEGVVFACPKCGGSLEIDGTDRMVKCKYCNSNVYLPDDLWLRLHPIKTVGTWYVGFDIIKAIKVKAQINNLKKKNIKNKENLKVVKEQIKELNNELNNLGAFKGKKKKELIKKIEANEEQLKHIKKKIDNTNDRIQNR